MNEKVSIGAELNLDSDNVPFVLKTPEPQTIDGLAEIFKVFGDITRLKILFILLEQEICVYDIAASLDMNPSAISHQLKILKQAKLVRCRRDGKQIFYTLADTHVTTILAQGMDHIKE